MNILLIQPYFDAIAHNRSYTIKIANELAKRGHSIFLLLNHIDDESEKKLNNTISVLAFSKPYRKYDLLKNTNKILWLLYRIYFNLFILCQVRLIIKKKKVDILHLLSYEIVSLSCFLFLYKVFFNNGVIEIAAANFDRKFYNKSTYRTKIWRFIMQNAAHYALRNFRAVNLNSNSHEKLLKEQLNLNTDIPIIKVIGDSREIKFKENFNFIDINLFPSLNKNFPTFLFFGTIREDKGLDDLISSISIINKNNFNANFIIVGKPLGYSISHMIKELNVSNIYTKFDFVDDEIIDYLYFISDYAVLPYNSKYTGSSGPLFEAVARGIPIVGSDVSEMGTLIKDNYLGFTTSPDSPDDLADAIKYSIKLFNSNQYFELVDSVKKFSIKNSSDSMINKLEELYFLTIK